MYLCQRHERDEWVRFSKIFGASPVVHRHWALIFSLAHTVPIDIGRHAPAETGIVHVAWPPKAANGWKNRPKASCRSLLPLCLYAPSGTQPPDASQPAQTLPLALRVFECAAQSLLEFGRARLQGDLGITAVLHTWGHDFHPHLHCIVTGGALSPDGKAWHCPKQPKFLFPLRALGSLFRCKFLARLATMLKAGELDLPDSQLQIAATGAGWLSALYSKPWVLYAKRPFGGPQQVLRYLANYTHRVALSNRRIVQVDASHPSVTFSYRDYRHGSKKHLTLGAQEFIRRFSLHILPAGLVRIRHYGILGNNRRKRDIQTARAIFQHRTPLRELSPRDVAQKPIRCPSCGKTGIRLVGFTDATGLLHRIGNPAPRCDSS